MTNNYSPRPPRCVLVNVTTSESIECLFNPTQLNEKIQVVWNRLVVPGLSHQVLQYQSTANRQLSGIEFYLDKFFAAQCPNHPDIMGFQTFLRTLTVSSANARDFSPPRVLFVWPGVLSFDCVLIEVEFQYRQFAHDGSVLVYTATCTFEELVELPRQ
ncbi:MAG: peptidoglycan-binding protein [Deltaproteobacteria bacterium RIFOXYA12_FULL_61_11]|nr:MAG: peptidoglycan-binding protein [Deltaproteobacteria bacterium RIFOXYA12_FULL_61_11]